MTPGADGLRDRTRDAIAPLAQAGRHPLHAHSTVR